MIKKIFLITLILILVGCQKAAEPETITPKPETTDISIESDISEINSLDEDLDMGELENLEMELEEINW